MPRSGSQRGVPEKELQIDLDSIVTRAQCERIVISRRGKPCAVLVGIEDDDAGDLGMASSEDFWRMIRERRTGGKACVILEIRVVDCAGITPLTLSSQGWD